MRCGSIAGSYSGFAQAANLRAKLKSPKLSSWEDCSPSRSSANNQKCNESSSRYRSLSLCPLSYSNPCITSVYASHLVPSLTGKAKSIRVSNLFKKQRRSHSPQLRNGLHLKRFYSGRPKSPCETNYIMGHCSGTITAGTPIEN